MFEINDLLLHVYLIERIFSTNKFVCVTSFFKVHACIRNKTGSHPDTVKVKCPTRRKQILWVYVRMKSSASRSM